jgi:hypothetical protein
MSFMLTLAGRRALGRALAVAALAAALLGGARPAQGANMPHVRHVFVIVLENKEFAETFGAGRLFAPYLTRTLVSQGALLPNYFGTGHASADNYIAMVAGQPPTAASKNDCPDPLVTISSQADANGVTQGGGGCVYPAKFKTVADQLVARHLTWKAYAQNIPAPCSLAHDAPGNYARKHNPSRSSCRCAMTASAPATISG